jgi:hypothetical protein
MTGPVYALNLFNLADRAEYLAYSRRSAKEVEAHGGRVVALGNEADLRLINLNRAADVTRSNPDVCNYLRSELSSGGLCMSVSGHKRTHASQQIELLVDYLVRSGEQ